MIRDGTEILLTANGNALVGQMVNPNLYVNHVVRFDTNRPQAKRCPFHYLSEEEAISGYTGGKEDFQKSRRMWIGLPKRETAPPSGFRSTEGEQAPKFTALAADEMMRLPIIRNTERPPFELPECVRVRYPCCFRVGPSGWATCL